MEPIATTRSVFSFGPFQIDPGDRVLRRDGVELPLTLKAAETLLVLVENAGHAVEKDALLSRVWADTFVEESTLAQNILTLRKTLGKQANGEEYIGTVPKRGYRFDASVSVTSRSAHEIGRELNVDFLLEGSVRRDQDRIRVSTRLIRASDQSSLWTADYDRELRDILTLESDVSRSIATQIALHLSAEQASRLQATRPVDAQAYELYLKGRHFWNRRTPDTINKAIELLQQAIARDPSYAHTHAALADCYVILSIYRASKPVIDSLKLAQAEANRALELDPSLGEAHTTLAYSYFYYWNFPAAEAEFQKSLQLTPRYATAHQWYAEYLRMMNRQEDAIAESNRALEIDPLSPIINVEAALPYYYRGENDKAAAQLLRTIDLDPYFASAHGHLCDVYNASGEYRQALQECLAAKTLGDADWIEVALGVTYVHIGQPEKAREILRTAPYAEIYLALGDKERAFAQLDRAFAEHEPTLVGMKVDPRLAQLRDEPRFQAMLRRIGFPP